MIKKAVSAVGAATLVHHLVETIGAHPFVAATTNMQSPAVLLVAERASPLALEFLQRKEPFEDVERWEDVLVYVLLVCRIERVAPPDVVVLGLILVC